jgi:hypothetical protein
MRSTLKAGLKLAAVLLLPVFALFLFTPSVGASAAPSIGIDTLTLLGATNTLGNYDETFFAQEALIQLEKVLGMAGRVHRGYSPQSKARGDTISIRRPATFTSTSMLDKWEGVTFGLTDKDLSLSAPQIITDHIRPAAVAIADKVDQTLAALYKKIPWVLAQTATPVLADILAVRKMMFDNRVPLNDKTMLHGMIDGATELAYLTAMAAAGQQSNTQDPSLREGSIGRIGGFDIFANQNTPTHTSGVSADATGAVDFGSGTTAVYAAGVSAIHIDGLTDNGTLLEGDSFVATNHSQRYVLTAASTESGTGDHDIAFYPPLKAALDEDEVITFTLTGSAKSQNLYWHRNAFALATAPLTTMGNELGAKVAVVADPITNLSLRSRMWYDGDNAKVMVGLDILYGVKNLDPNLAVRHYDA